MSDISAVIFLVIGVLLCLLSIILRSKTNSKYEFKIIDLTLILIPLFLWLIVTGKIQRVVIGDIEFETAQAFISASRQPIEKVVVDTTPTPINDVVHVVEHSLKGDVSRIPELIASKTEALEFQIGHGGYWGPAIQTYFESLSAMSFLKYAIIHNQDGTFFGMFHAQSLMKYFKVESYSSYDQFASALNVSDRTYLKQLPGFISSDYAVLNKAHKKDVLAKMEQLNQEILPVIDESGRFVGIIERSQLTARLIMDVIDSLKKTE